MGIKFLQLFIQISFGLNIYLFNVKYLFFNQINLFQLFSILNKCFLQKKSQLTFMVFIKINQEIDRESSGFFSMLKDK